jgi:hypothetical protein
MLRENCGGAMEDPDKFASHFAGIMARATPQPEDA